MGTQFKSGGNSENMREQFNALVADVEAIRVGLAGTNAQLDADATVTDTDYAANNDAAAATAVDLTLGI